jgi:putative hydrolase of the HAD superfamily
MTFPASGKIPSVTTAILFDLDETLILDHPVSRHALLDCAYLAAGARALNAPMLAKAAERVAGTLWKAAPTWPYAERIGHSALEGLWARYDSRAHPVQAQLREGALSFRMAVWRGALLEQQITDEALCARLAERFVRSRALFPRYPEVDALLAALAPKYKLGIVTNGVPNLQRDKLAGSGLASRFSAAVAVSGELDCGKPDKGIFEWALGELGVGPGECVMVGDNPERDIAGATAMGMRSVFVDRGIRPADPKHPADLSVKSLGEMLPWLEK